MRLEMPVWKGTVTNVNGNNASSQRSSATKSIQQRVPHSIGAFRSVESTSPDVSRTPITEKCTRDMLGGSMITPISKQKRRHEEHGGRALYATSPTGPPTATAPAASSAAHDDGTKEFDLWEDNSWQRCLIVYIILVGVIGLALIFFVTVGSTSRHHALEETTRRAFTRISPQARVLVSSNASSRLPNPVTADGDHVAHVPTAAATLVDEGDGGEEDTTTED
ncbi:hypothetical protein MRX96_039485 [Rhipicephalus microplus]